MKIYPFDVYQMYLATKFHFDGPYNYWKYHGELTHSQKVFEARSDFFYFVKLARKFEVISDIEDLFFSNYMYGDGFHIIDLCSPDASKVMKNWKSRMQAIDYHFEQDLMIMKNKSAEFDKLFAGDNDYPLIVKMVQQKEIFLETLVIFYFMFPKIFAKYSCKYDDLIWNNFYIKFEKFADLCKKYSLDDKKRFAFLVKKVYN